MEEFPEIYPISVYFCRISLAYNESKIRSNHRYVLFYDKKSNFVTDDVKPAMLYIVEAVLVLNFLYFLQNF